MTLVAIHPAEMPVGMSAQYTHILESVKETFLTDGELPKLANSCLIHPKVFKGNNFERDIFVVTIPLFDEVPHNGDAMQVAKAALHERLIKFKPESHHHRVLGLCEEDTRSIHILPQHWGGRYYDNSHTFSILIQGLLHEYKIVEPLG